MQALDETLSARPSIELRVFKRILTNARESKGDAAELLGCLEEALFLINKTVASPLRHERSAERKEMAPATFEGTAGERSLDVTPPGGVLVHAPGAGAAARGGSAQESIAERPVAVPPGGLVVHAPGTGAAARGGECSRIHR